MIDYNHCVIWSVEVVNCAIDSHDNMDDEWKSRASSTETWGNGGLFSLMVGVDFVYDLHC